MGCFKTARKAIYEFFRSCLCHSEETQRGDANNANPGEQFYMNFLGHQAPTRHRLAPCSPRFHGPETLEIIRVAIETLEKIEKGGVEEQSFQGPSGEQLQA